MGPVTALTSQSPLKQIPKERSSSWGSIHSGFQQVLCPKTLDGNEALVPSADQSVSAQRTSTHRREDCKVTFTLLRIGE